MFYHNKNTNIKKKEHLFLIILIIVAAGLRLYHLGYYSLWMDEVFQVRLQSRANGIAEIIELASYQNQPPLDYLIGWVISRFIPFSEFSARLPSFIFGVCTVIISFFFTKRLFGFWTAALSSVMLSLSTILIYFSQETRPYSIFFFFLMVLLGWFFKILESSRDNIWQWLIFTSLACLTLITRGMTPVTALIALNLAFVISILTVFIDKREFVYPFSLPVLRNLVISTGIAGLFYVPFFIIIWKKSHHYVGETRDLASPAWSYFEPFYLILTKIFPHNLENYSLFCLTGFICGAFYITKNRKQQPGRFIFLLYAILEPLVSIYLYYIIVDVNVLKPKNNYFVQSIIPVFIISSYGYFSVITPLSKQFTDRGRFIVCSMPVILALFLAIPQLPDYYSTQKADYRGAVNYLRTIYKNEDVAVFDTFRQFKSWEPRLYGKDVYYGKQLKIRQYNWETWSTMLENGFQTNGRLFLFLHNDRIDSPHFVRGPYFSNNDAIIERNFEQLAIVSTKNTSLSLKDTSLLYLDEMLIFFPEDSSRVDLYLAKAKLLCQNSPELAIKNLKLAENILAGEKIEYQCN